MKKSVLIIGLICILISTSFISSATLVTKEDNYKPLPTKIYSKYFYGPVNVSTSIDFLTTRSFIRKSLIFKDTAILVFAWEIVNGKMYLDTPRGPLELGPGSSFIANMAKLSYSGIEQEGLPPLIKFISLSLRITYIELTELNGQAWEVKVRSPEPI